MYIHHPSEANLNELFRLLKHYPIPIDEHGKKVRFDYGTAGFRCHHELLAPVMLRMGIFASLRSATLNGDAVGIMITASHNPETDNGVKLADSNGGMLPMEWEEMASNVANTDDFQNLNVGNTPTVVHVGWDTRPHSFPFSQLAIQAAVAMGSMVIVHGNLTTPMLHFHVLRSNPHNMHNLMICGKSGKNFETDYVQSIIGSYISLLSTKRSRPSQSYELQQRRELVVDCACGVGGLMIPILNEELEQYVSGGILFHEPLIKLIPVNLPGDGPLNERCGAEYVQKQQQPPIIYTHLEGSLPSNYMVSFDGDADRIIFHYLNENNQLKLMDGDKIGSLVSSFLQAEMDALAEMVPDAKRIRCGIVQTAYANGASTHYLKDVVKTKVVMAKTGVKYVHTAAHESFDVGTYFEANGHGTVLFGPKFYDLMAKAEQQLICTNRHHRSNIAWQRLRVLPSLINQTVGDSISDLFLVDAILYLKDFTFDEWNQIYHDLPSRQCKVKVTDRSMILTNDTETRTTKPENLQHAIDAAIQAQSLNTAVSIPPRAFVRPSGTEDAVRIYAEAYLQTDADALASKVAAIVYEKCAGVGDLPTFHNSKV